MSEPKLTEAQIEALKGALGDYKREWAREVVHALAPVIAEAEKTARAEAWDEGYILGVADLAMYRRPGTANPYREATP